MLFDGLGPLLKHCDVFFDILNTEGCTFNSVLKINDTFRQECVLFSDIHCCCLANATCLGLCYLNVSRVIRKSHFVHKEHFADQFIHFVHYRMVSLSVECSVIRGHTYLYY